MRLDRLALGTFLAACSPEGADEQKAAADPQHEIIPAECSAEAIEAAYGESLSPDHLKSRVINCICDAARRDTYASLSEMPGSPGNERKRNIANAVESDCILRHRRPLGL